MVDLDAACEEIAKGIFDTEFCVEDVNTSVRLCNVDAALQSDVAGVRVPTEQQVLQQPESVLPEPVADAGPISMSWVALNFADQRALCTPARNTKGCVRSINNDGSKMSYRT